jgi:hypothetical protein
MFPVIKNNSSICKKICCFQQEKINKTVQKD